MHKSHIARNLLLLSAFVILAAIGMTAWIFWDIGTRFPHLALSLAMTPSAQQEEACRELLRRRDRSAVPLLVRALSNSEWRVAMGASDALDELGDKTLIPELLRIAADPTSENGRMYAISTLGKVGDHSVVPYLISCLSDPHTLIQRNAAFSLGELKAKDAVDPLIATLRDPTFMYRSSAAMSLGMIGDSRAFEPLVEMLKTESDQHQASGAAEGLGDLGDTRAAPILLLYIHDSRWYVASEAITALGKLKHPSSVEPLRAIIADSKSSRDLVRVAKQALDAIADTGSAAEISR